MLEGISVLHERNSARAEGVAARAHDECPVYQGLLAGCQVRHAIAVDRERNQ